MMQAGLAEGTSMQDLQSVLRERDSMHSMQCMQQQTYRERAFTLPKLLHGNGPVS